MQSELKSVIVIGGAGALGRSVVKTFKNMSPAWNVLSIDLVENQEANENIILQKNFDKSTIVNINNTIKNNFDCIINVAGGWRGETLKNEEIVIVHDIMHKQNVASSVLAAYLAKKYLNKNGLLVLTGAAAVKDNYGSNMLAYQLAKNSVHYLTEILAKNPQELPENAKIITLLPYKINRFLLFVFNEKRFLRLF